MMAVDDDAPPLTDRVRRVIVEHNASDHGDNGEVSCSCGAERLSDHPRHVAEQIVSRLSLRPEADHLKKQIRYASAWFDWELTQLEGREC